MDLSKIVFTLEFDTDSANVKANEMLKKGWTLISVGPKLITTPTEENQNHYATAYVVGATQEQYDTFLKETIV